MIIKECLVCKNKYAISPYKEKTSKYCSIPCKNIGTKETMKGMISHWRGKKRNPDWNKKTSQTLSGKMAGEKHPQWKGGISGLRARVYSTIEYKKWRAQIYKRDNWTCQTCNNKGNGNLEAHHIYSLVLLLKENKINNLEEVIKCEKLWNINNGITLCKGCHKLTDNYGRKGKSQKIG